MFDAFPGVVVAELCEQFAAYCVRSPRAAQAAAQTLARQIRANLVDGPGAKAALLAALGK